MVIRMDARAPSILAGVIGLLSCSSQHYDPGLVTLAKEWSTVDLNRLPVGAPALVVGRRVGVLFRGGAIEEYLHTQHPSPIAATREEVGVIVLIQRDNDTAPRIYPTGAKDYGAMFHFAAIAIPERVVVGRWDRYEAPPNDTPMIRGKGYQTLAGSGTTIHEGLGNDEVLADVTTLVGGAVPSGKPR